MNRVIEEANFNQKNYEQKVDAFQSVLNKFD